MVIAQIKNTPSIALGDFCFKRKKEGGVKLRGGNTPTFSRMSECF